jgi:hypothetical protein
METQTDQQNTDVLPSENNANGTMTPDDFGEILNPVFDKLMELHVTNLQLSQSREETHRLHDKSSNIQEYLLGFCDTQLEQFRKISSETQSDQEKDKLTKLINLYEELRGKIQAEDPENYI